MKLSKGLLVGALLMSASMGMSACSDDDDDGAGPPDTETITLATVRNNVTGTAVLTDLSGGTSTVQVTLQNLTVGETYPGHIHSGDCTASPGPIVFALQSITATAATGSATTNSVPDSLLATGYYIQYHIQMTDSLPPVACGTIN